MDALPNWSIYLRLHLLMYFMIRKNNTMLVSCIDHQSIKHLPIAIYNIMHLSIEGQLCNIAMYINYHYFQSLEWIRVTASNEEVNETVGLPAYSFVV